ncbi:unnamed protein product [Parascedosporium putredinis]|uniref:L-type lectin-like domain-containing protein n=1 Tax=Parascedosporium putredinis TaxID=1442378 RepID=A0A9P1H9C3_9PEZI|nr:unnamed protein product [Parascedosporium putredinis]CAI8000088.1 unnamed protein product [Parascedosporium putredinis]
MLPSKSSLAALLLAAGTAQAQYLINELSFGYDGKMSPNNDGKIPNFYTQGSPNPPEILSNRVVLTPVAPGNQRSAIWAENPMNYDTWVADVDFRSSGPERGGGNLNIWLANRGPSDIAQSSVYTVQRFEGLAVVIDNYGGTGGMLRAFLNDGSIDFTTKTVLDSLVFGQCYYSYRNLGRPSQIKMRQEPDTDPFGLQVGYHGRLPDNPDSFEIFKMVVMSDKMGNAGNAASSDSKPKPKSPPKKAPVKKAPPKKKAVEKKEEEAADDADPANFFQRDGEDSGSDDGLIPDDPLDAAADVDILQISRSQFQDVNERVQSLGRHITTMYRTLTKQTQTGDDRHAEIARLIGDLRSEMRRLEGIDELQKKIGVLERDVKALRGDLTNKFRATESNFKSTLADHHDNIVSAHPKLWKIIGIFIVCQTIVTGMYIAYKKKQRNSVKKYI